MKHVLLCVFFSSTFLFSNQTFDKSIKNIAAQITDTIFRKKRSVVGSNTELLAFIQLLEICSEKIAGRLNDDEVVDFHLLNNGQVTRKGCWNRFDNLLVKGSLVACNSAQIYGNVKANGMLHTGGNTTVGNCDASIGDVIIADDLTVCGNTTINGNVFLNGAFVEDTGTFLDSIQLEGAPEQACIIFSDSAFNEKARICSSSIVGQDGLFISVDGGITQNFQVNDPGTAIIMAPSSGVALDIVGNASAPALSATGNGTVIAPPLTLINNPASSSSDNVLTIDILGVVRQSAFSLNDFVISGCQSGPLTIGTSDATLLTLATNGCTPRLTISSNGGVTIATPAAAEVGLTIQGGGEVITAGDLVLLNGNVTLPAATGGVATSAATGLLELGGANSSATNVSVFNVGTRNLVASNYATVPSITGSDNISVGSSSNSALTAANNTIAIGSAARATVSDAVALGTGAAALAARTIVVGSRDSANSGAAPTAGGTNAIAIGSASGTMAGAAASNLSAIAIGGADGIFAGPSASGTRTIAMGLNARATAANGIAIGSASGTAGSTAPQATNSNAIAIGSASGVRAASIASGESAVAIGGVGLAGSISGPLASGSHAIGIGTNAVASSNVSIALGSGSGSGTTFGPQATNNNTIAIGSATTVNPGPVASGISAIAIGSGTGSLHSGAQALGSHSIGIGAHAGANSDFSIVVGSVAGSVAGINPRASNTNAIALGGTLGPNQAPLATGVSAIAIGAASTTLAGATASGARSVALGVGASTAQDDAIILGSVATAAVRVGIGNTNPTAKLHVANSNTTGLLVTGTATFPVVQLTAGSTAIQSQPVWTNPNSTGVAGTPIHYDASNRLFGFSSSARYKTNIRPLESSDVLYDLNPVLYDAKEGHGQGKDIPGFIAEDTYKVAPWLAILNAQKQPESVAYNGLLALAVKEIQKQRQMIEKHADIIKARTVVIEKLFHAIAELCTAVELKEVGA